MTDERWSDDLAPAGVEANSCVRWWPAAVTEPMPGSGPKFRGAVRGDQGVGRKCRAAALGLPSWKHP